MHCGGTCRQQEDHLKAEEVDLVELEYSCLDVFQSG
jgi:hypothetical protein